MPPLRYRKDDVIELTRYFLERHRTFRPLSLSAAATDALLAYDWPGNVRELERVIERAVALAGGPFLELDDLPPALLGDYVEALLPALRAQSTMRAWGSRYARLVLERCSNNKRQACRQLGICTTRSRDTCVRGRKNRMSEPRDNAHSKANGRQTSGMMSRYLACSMVVAILVCGCAGQRPTPAWQVRFGPVVGDEIVVGRVVVGNTVWLATSRDAVVRIDLLRRRWTRVLLHPLQRNERVRSLASTGAGAMWALIGRTTLVRVHNDGSIGRRIALRKPHTGIFGTRRDLVFQILNLRPWVPALEASPPGGETRHAWSSMQTRTSPPPFGVVAALNLVSCGATTTAVIPCWFPDQPSLTLTDDSGSSRELILEGLLSLASEARPGSAIPRPTIHDAFVSEDAVWVLAAGESARVEVGARSGGWLLARYDLDGRLFRRVQLPEPVRVLLTAHDETCIVLSWSGHVVEVQA